MSYKYRLEDLVRDKDGMVRPAYLADLTPEKKDTKENYTHPQISKFVCECAGFGQYEWVEEGEEKICPYCGEKLEPVEIIHKKIEE